MKVGGAAWCHPTVVHAARASVGRAGLGLQALACLVCVGVCVTSGDEIEIDVDGTHRSAMVRLVLAVTAYLVGTVILLGVAGGQYGDGVAALVWLFCAALLFAMVQWAKRLPGVMRSLMWVGLVWAPLRLWVLGAL